MSRTLNWFKVAEHLAEIDFNLNGMTVIEIERKKIGLGRSGDRLFAFSPKCPHAGGLLTEGIIDGKCQVVCPLHRYKFSLENGRNTSGEGYHLKCWPIEVRTDGIFVQMEQPGLFGW